MIYIKIKFLLYSETDLSLLQSPCISTAVVRTRWADLANEIQPSILSLRVTLVSFGLLCSTDGKDSACSAGDPSLIPSGEEPPEERMATPSSTLA